jgi:SAM-dependent methyltransferase
MTRLASEMTANEAVWQEIECGSYAADLPLWRELVAETRAGGSCELLDLGCGCGRVSLALAGRDCRVTGIDVEAELIAVLRLRARDRGAPVDALVADARSFELDRRFDLALAPMQLVQLFRAARDRISMLACVARHLRPGGRVALALLDLEEEWAAAPEAAPLPDVLERDGWVFSSQPVAVRRAQTGATIELDRLRRATSPEGELSEALSQVRLELVTPGQLEREGRRAGLAPERRDSVPATEDHVGSAVVVLSGA